MGSPLNAEARAQILFAVPMATLVWSSLLIQLLPIRGSLALVGLSGALEILCGQGFGARMYKMLGIYLQASCIISFVFSIIISVLWFFTEPILVLLDQDPEISRTAALYIKTRVSNELGAAKPNRAKHAMAVTLKLSILLALVVILTLASLYHIWAGFFPERHSIIKKFAEMTPFLIVSIVIDAIQDTLFYNSVHILVTIMTLSANLGTFYFIGMPIAILVGFKFKLYVPMVLSNVFYFLITMISVMFSGHLGEVELAASTLADSWATVTVVLTLAFGHDIWAAFFSDSHSIIKKFAKMTPLPLVSIAIQGVFSGVVRGCGTRSHDLKVKNLRGTLIWGHFTLLACPLRFYLDSSLDYTLRDYGWG
ncbi:hypothetical protein F3Y22_tig00001120pilonHSYRG00290 [Hibiscus syriacus]|uniref:Uncharacterized protein n=1 Tax=Hibiscus syriacus TaxID=106335 RepID=A0A6A3D2I0_HIBSY|nr:hypothetical protein F3Y22_tig00001120pilonHSYRG00290 [Hibiscus syriacus]